MKKEIERERETNEYKFARVTAIVVPISIHASAPFLTVRWMDLAFIDIYQKNHKKKKKVTFEFCKTQLSCDDNKTGRIEYGISMSI